MARLYRQLRGRLLAEGIDAPYLAEKLHVHPNTLSRAMTGKRSFTLSECYTILDLINEPESKLIDYFPKGGRAS